MFRLCATGDRCKLLASLCQPEPDAAHKTFWPCYCAGAWHRAAGSKLPRGEVASSKDALFSSMSPSLSPGSPTGSVSTSFQHSAASKGRDLSRLPTPSQTASNLFQLCRGHAHPSRAKAPCSACLTLSAGRIVVVLIIIY